MPRLWVGVDVGKLAHHVAAVDHAGRCVLSRRVSNDEADIALVIHEVSSLGRPASWAVDVPTSMAFLLLAMLRRDRFEVRYVAGFVRHRMRAAFTGEHKTDVRDAQVLAHTARMRPDLPVLEPVDELLIELNLLISRRAEMNAGRTNAIMKLRNLLTGISPPLERVLDVRSKGPLTLLGFRQTPAAIRAAGPLNSEADRLLQCRRGVILGWPPHIDLVPMNLGIAANIAHRVRQLTATCLSISRSPYFRMTIFYALCDDRESLRSVSTHSGGLHGQCRHGVVVRSVSQRCWPRASSAEWSR